MTRVLSLLAVLLASFVAPLGMAAAPAAADTATVRDPAGDAAGGPGRGLDITGASIDNGPKRLVVELTFDSLHRGDLVVSVSPRGGGGLRLVSYYRPGGPSRSFVVSGSFDDLSRGRVRCGGFDAHWNSRAATARLTMPASCLSHAEYGDLRLALLTETGGGDSDYAPGRGGRLGHTPWIARG